MPKELKVSYTIKGLDLNKMPYETTIIAALVKRAGGTIEMDLSELENIEGFMFSICNDKILIKAT